MKILLFSSAYNGLCQRVHRELVMDGHQVSIELSSKADDMVAAVVTFAPDLIVCPFLKHRVPETIWREHPCLIVHPGIEGDRGPSSLDYAVIQSQVEWGVTLLQAAEEMDAGDIWGTETFIRRETAKASLYRREVTSAAVKLVRAAIEQHQDPEFIPRPLDYSAPHVRGTCQPLMRQSERGIDWQTDSTVAIVRKINAADSFPGVLDLLDGNAVYLFGAKAEYRPASDFAPGTIIGRRDGAVCIAARDGLVWVRQMKMAAQEQEVYFKLPAYQVISQQFAYPERYADLPTMASPVMNEVTATVRAGIAYLEFNFYNGAMNTAQCRQLLNELRILRRREDVRVIALMGGEDFWSNGIHLNCIEAAPDPARESWLNINAIDDVVREILLMDDKITVAALRNNAGAGGAIMPLACDRVLIRSGVVLNPHYLTMGLYGSEYWTYLLPRRVGEVESQSLIHGCLPVLADEAFALGMADEVLAESWDIYHQQLVERCEQLAADEHFSELLEAKASLRQADELVQPLESYRTAELQRMKATFDDPDSDYHRLRYNFVHKISCGKTPARLVAPADQPAQLALA